MTDDRNQTTATFNSGTREDLQDDRSSKVVAGVPGKRRSLTPDDQLEIVRRVQKGESQSAIARELGLSRQRISAIMKKFEKGGAEGFVHRKRGPKSGPVPREEIVKLIAMLRDQSPSEFGFKKTVKWTFEKAEVASVRVWGRKAPKRHLRAAFKEAGVELAYDTDPDADIYTPEFEAYLRSERAKKIREREAAYHKRLEEQGLVNRPRKMGRPTKEEAARRAALPWNPNGRDASSKPNEADSALPPEAGLEEDDIDVPDWNNLSPEQMQELQVKYNMAPYLSGKGRRPPGTRVGKHRKQRAPSSPGRNKRRKKPKKR